MLNRTQTQATWPAILVILLVTAGLALAATQDDGAAQDDGMTVAKRMSLSDFIRAGSYVGYVIIWLSFVGLALVIDGFLRIQPKKLIPPMLSDRLVHLARGGKFSEIQNLCQTLDCMLSRIVGHTFSQGSMSLDAARQVMQEQGTREVTRLYQRVGYIGFIAAVSPMLGLLGTVTGMINSFNVLGTAKGTARPDELAVGVAEALVTTCMGLVVAIPLMFCHNYLRDRVTRIGQDAAGLCERIMRTLAEGQAIRDRDHARAAQTVEPGPQVQP